MEGGKRGELANRTRNAKAALMQRADDADHEAMSDGLFDAAILINSSPYIQRPPRTVDFCRK